MQEATTPSTAPVGVDELAVTIDRFGPGLEVVFEGPADRCPVCTGVIDQLVLDLDLVSTIPACCSECGAVLAA